MANRSISGTSSRDPYELERLAQELAEREQLSPHKKLSFDENETAYELPLYVPLSHDNPYFTAETFNVEEFLLSRSHTSLPDLRSELRDYLARLKEELVKLINDDYEAFISLSTDLRGEGARLERLRIPLGDLRAQVLESKNELQMVQDSIQNKLKKRSELREEKAFLHLLLKINESVTRLESLLLIASADDAASPDGRMLPMTRSLGGDEENFDERARTNRAKHLARVAGEYTQLLYHVAKAQSEGSSAFVDDIQWRINRIQSTLSSDLDHLFVSTLTSLADTQNKTDRTKFILDVSECLKTYDMLGLWRDAEDALRRELVREFVKKTIFPGALTAPHSPVMPSTPFPIHDRPPQTASFPPRTPYTPFTAFASKDMSFDTVSATAHLLDEHANPLAGLYNTILKFVERDVKQIMDIAERITSKSAGKAAASASGSTSTMPEACAFDILANVVWAEVGKAVMDELGTVVFAAGKPSEFRKNHETTYAFIRSLQFLAPSARAVAAMIDHPTFHAFERRWQLQVYYQLRWKEIVPPLEESLASLKVESVASKDSAFSSQQAAAVWVAIETCWSEDVFMPQLAHRFWRLTLQALSRYRTWLESGLPSLDAPIKIPASATRERMDSPGAASPRASTPTAENAAVDTAAENTALRQLALAMVDIKAVEAQTLQLWREAISIMLPEPSEDEDDVVPYEEALRATMATLTDLLPALSAQIVAILARRACEALTPVRSIPSQFRAMSNKKTPSEPSYFVEAIMRPVKAFFGLGAAADGVGAGLKAEYIRPYAEEVFEAVVQKFISYLAGLKKTEESLRRLKKGKKSTFSLFGSQPDDSRDEERIRTQMILDVQAFGKDAAALGVDVQRSESFKALDELVHTSFADDPNPT